jgi:hypothetical protein
MPESCQKPHKIGLRGYSFLPLTFDSKLLKKIMQVIEIIKMNSGASISH